MHLRIREDHFKLYSTPSNLELTTTFCCFSFVDRRMKNNEQSNLKKILNFICTKISLSPENFNLGGSYFREAMQRK